MVPPTTQPTVVNAAEIRSTCLQSDAGFRVELLNLGASIRSIQVPVAGRSFNLVLSYPDVTDYLSDPYYLGSTLGRYANRIEGARIQLDGQSFELEETPGQSGHCLHGGSNGFSHRLWELDGTDEPRSVRFRLLSDDGDQGFPGRVKAEVIYRLLDGWTLEIEHRAVSGAPTAINLANHAYFNLNSDGAPAENHCIFINADRFTPVDQTLIPTGELRDVNGTVFDFRAQATFTDRVQAGDEQLKIGNGFDHNYELNRIPGSASLAATVRSPQSGLVLKVHTTQPGLQFYTGQFLNDPFRPIDGICLECQGFPNAPNTPGFPGAILRPGEIYQQRTIFEFST